MAALDVATGVRERAASSKLAPHLALVVCLLAWSANAVVLKIGLLHVRPIPFTTARFFIGGAVLLALGAAAGRGVPRPPRAGLLVPAALLGVVCNQLTFTEGLHLTTAVDTSLIMGLSPILTAVVLVAWTRVAVPRSQWIALAIGFAGVVAVVAESGRGGDASLTGDLIVVGAPASWAIYLVLMDRQGGRTPLTVLAPWSMLVGAAVLLPAAIVLGGPGRDDWAGAAWPLAYASLLATALAWTLYFWALPRIGVTATSIYTYLQPPLGAFFGFLFLHERVGVGQLAGAALILAAAYLGSWRPAARRQAPPAEAC